jgi:hypothetical protein
MKTLILVLAFGSLVFATATPSQAARVGYFLGSGLTGTSTYGFQGGWGLAGGVEIPIARYASFVAQGEYQVLPTTPEVSAMPLSTNELGRPIDGATNASLSSAVVGLRVQPEGTVRPYLDALVGVGHVQDHSYGYNGPDYQERDETNVLLSLGSGVRWSPPASVGSLFLDAHLQFYYVQGIDQAVAPIRMGLIYP